MARRGVAEPSLPHCTVHSQGGCARGVLLRESRARDRRRALLLPVIPAPTSITTTAAAAGRHMCSIFTYLRLAGKGGIYYGPPVGRSVDSIDGTDAQRKSHKVQQRTERECVNARTWGLIGCCFLLLTVAMLYKKALNLT